MIATVKTITRALLVGALMISVLPASADPAPARSVAMLGVFLQNDNEGYQPTSDAERARMTALEAQFKSTLEQSAN